ncbi:hypothetical protein KUCAC02_009576 [Chaenocephalus aceratus]|nr:hypothetical protein KUCAC02_009576 [Chaenocephalus aceratus]
MEGKWRSADVNDYLCGQCQRPIEVEQTPSKPSSPSKFRPRGFVKPEEREPLWRSGLKTSTVWEHQARVGPVMVLPAKQKSRPIPTEELSSILDQTSRSTMYGRQWRSGINRVDQRKGLLPDSSSTQNQSKAAVLNSTHTAALDEVLQTAVVNVAVPPLSNTTATEADLSETMDPKR